MQGKGLVRFFLIVLTIVCIYQLSFTLVSSNVEKSAQEYAEQSVDPTLSGKEKVKAVAELRGDFLSKKATETVYNIGIAKYNYDEVRERAINLGLDLQGGMSVVLEVSKYELIKNVSNNPKNAALVAALDKANAESIKGNGDIINLFQEYYEDANPGSQLVALFKSNDNKELAATASNNEVISFLKSTAESGIQSTFTKLKERIDKFGVASPYITLQENTGRIIVELAGVDNPKQVRALLQSTANLQFWETWQYAELESYLFQTNDILKGLNEDGKIEETADSTNSLFTTNSIDTLVEDTTNQTLDSNSLLENTLISESSLDSGETEVDSSSQTGGPLSDILTFTNQGPVLGLVNNKDTFQLMQYLKMEEVKAIFPTNLIFMLSASPMKDEAGNVSENYELYAMKPKLDDSAPLLDGDIIRSAAQTYDQTNGEAQVTMQMKSDGAKKWRRITADNKGKFVAIVLDNRVYSAPRINEEIPNGNSVISGSFDVKDAQVLANILETGKLPVPSRIVQEDIVGPSLGADSIRVGVISLIAGLLLVIAFMAFYYSKSGLIADVALFANIFFIFGVLASLGATLTLPGIAGLVLTMGMAVDANVIIFERIKEELAKGKSMIKAISDGYMGSYSAIIDGNVTTLIIAFILSSVGSGPVKGFAVVLIIGILSSLFTSIFISRLILDRMAKKEKQIKFYTSFSKSAFQNVKFDFMGKRRIGYMISGGLTIIGLIFILGTGFDLGVDFKGGRSYTVKFDQAISVEEVRTSLSTGFDDKVQVKSFSGNDKLKITTSKRIDENSPETDSIVALEIYQNIEKFYNSKPTFEEWDRTFKESQMKVEPTVASDIKLESFKAIGLGLLAIFIYIIIRFRKWQFGAGALVSLIHDAFMVVAMFAILKNIMPFSLEINEAFIAAILTVIGYSINDTVVVFDRIREFLKESRSGTIPQIFNAAITQTLSRTVITSGTTILSIVVLLIFGNENIQGFAFALFIGIGFGTYSSVFIASAIAVDLYKKEERKKQADVIMK